MGDKIWDYKETIKYHFMTRSTISYNENNCSVSIDGALSILDDMRNASSKSNISRLLFMMSLMVTITIFGMGINVMKGYLKGSLDYFDAEKVRNVTIGSCVLAAFSLALCIASAINLPRVIAETSALEAWSTVDGCVKDDEYMRLNEAERTSVESKDRDARLSFALACLTFICQLVIVVWSITYGKQ